MELMDFSHKRGVIEATDQPVHLVLSFHPELELFELLRSIHWLPVVVEDRCSVQWLGVYLVAVIVQSDDDGVRVEYDLHILHLFDVTVETLDGERYEVISVVWLEPQWHLATFESVASLV